MNQFFKYFTLGMAVTNAICHAIVGFNPDMSLYVLSTGIALYLVTQYD